jgi:hypothetical protein
MVTSAGATYRLVTDQVGSVRPVDDTASGAVVERIDWDELGNVLTDSAPETQPFGFAGGLRDNNSSLTRLAARDYDAVTGSWTCPRIGSSLQEESLLFTLMLVKIQSTG